MFTLNCRGKLFVADAPKVMGIINVTPDSFYRGNIHDDLLQLATGMVEAGAAILDIGGQSTRPGSERIPEKLEMERVLPVIGLLRQHFPELVISIDTYYSSVAEAAVNLGATMVNDISSGNMDKNMISTVAALNVPYICMHMKGTPETMQQQAVYTNLITEITDYFISKIAACSAAGINDIIIDPGFGFAKTVEQNLLLLKSLSALSIFGLPVLCGLSRKSTIYKTLNISAAEALNGTTVLNTLALMNGASILRVHDVKEAVEAVKLTEAYKHAG